MSTGNLPEVISGPVNATWRVLEQTAAGKIEVVEYKLAATRWGLRVVMANQKGGTAKSTNTINAAAEDAAAGLNVLVLDLDPQANASKGLGVKQLKLDLTAYEVLHPKPKERVAIEEAIFQVRERLYVVPGDLALADIEQNGAGHNTEMLLARALRQVKDRFHKIYVDVPPALGRLLVMALSGASDDAVGALIPVKAGPYELEGLGKLLDTFDELRANGLGDQLSVLGTITTMYDARRGLDQRVDNYLKTNFPNEHIARPIRGAVRVAEAADKGIPLREFAPRELVNGDFANLAYLTSKRALS